MQPNLFKYYKQLLQFSQPFGVIQTQDALDGNVVDSLIYPSGRYNVKWLIVQQDLKGGNGGNILLFDLKTI